MNLFLDFRSWIGNLGWDTSGNCIFLFHSKW